MASLNPHAQPFYGFNYYYIYDQPFVPPVYPHTYDHQLPYYPPPNLYANYMEHTQVAQVSGSERVRWRNDKGKRSVGPIGSMRQKQMNIEASSSNNGGVIPFPSTLEEQVRSSTTTVMVKNIPNQLSRGVLLRILRRHCWEENRKTKGKDALYSDRIKSMFDFVYLPLDFKKLSYMETISNLGYAFVNFTTPAAAQRFYRHFHNREWKKDNYNKKICHVTCAKIQGKRALKETFENKIFWCLSEECLPVIVEPACDGFKSPKVCPVGRLFDPWF